MQFLTKLVLLTALVALANGHGRLITPAGRATLWRYSQYAAFNPPANYDDNQLFCGGVQVQYEENGGKCGVCGDPYNEPQPRKHEGGGFYGRGIIAAEYKQGQVIEVEVDLTASHLGYFEFSLCEQNNPLVPATEECFNKHILPLADGSGTRFYINNFDKVIYKYLVKLPEGVTCHQCILRWHYHTGNSYGTCSDGSFELGCGNQETFRSCADVRITP